MVIKNVFIELLEYFTKRFVEKMGRAPQTPSELMSIQNDAVRHLNKTKGNPKKLTPQSMINERYRAANPFIGFKPTVVQGGKSKEGIGTLLKDSPEAIAKIKADNKAAVERLKKKKTDNPEDMASGGIARVGMYAGGIPKGLMALLKGIQKKFGKKALYKGDEVVIDNKIFKLSNKKRQMTADELEDFEMDIGDALEGYDFDGTVGSAEKILKEQKAYERYMYNQYKAGRLDPKPGEPNRKRFLEKKLEEMEMSGDKKLMTREEIEELESFNLEDEMFDAEGKLNKKAVLQEVRDSEEKMLLDKFDVKGRTKQASGGIARVGYAGGRLVKGASWVINKLKEQLFDMDLGIGGSRFSKLSSTQKEGFKNELKTLIKQLEQGGEIPNEMLDTMIADPKFKSVVKTRSTDKDLFELEGALLDRQAAKQADQIEGEAWDRGRDVVDSLTGPKEIKRRKQIDMLEKFDVKDRKSNASGGRAGSGLNYLLGEDDQNVRMPSGGLPGLLGE